MRTFSSDCFTERIMTETGVGFKSSILVVTTDDDGNFVSAKVEQQQGYLEGAPQPDRFA